MQHPFLMGGIMKKILILGCPGSGKSTLANKLSKKLNIKVYHLDKLWWRGNWENVSKEEFKYKLNEILKNKSFIIDGNYMSTIDMRISKCDTIIYLDFNTLFCLYRIIKRYFKNRGRVRDDMGGNCVEKLDLEFISYVFKFNRNYRDDIYSTIKNSKKDVIVFKSIRKLNKWINTKTI